MPVNVKTNLYEQWGQKAAAAAQAMDASSFFSVEHTAAKVKLTAYQDGCRLLHEADGLDHVKAGLRERMKNTFLRERRDFYARMLNDIEVALDTTAGGGAR